MNKLLTTVFGLSVACATTLAYLHAPAVQAQAPAPGSAPAAAAATRVPGTPGAKSIEAKAAMCIGCHGIPGYQASFPEVHKVPMISGQNARYIAAALTAYKQGDRKHPTMRGIAESLTEQDINDLAAWYESHGVDRTPGPATPPREQPSPRVAALLQKAACASCHGADFSTPIDPSYPKIAGQHADYLFVAMKAYKMDGNQAVGRNNAVMGAISRQFTTDELRALANYIADIEGDLLIKPEPKFR